MGPRNLQTLSHQPYRLHWHLWLCGKCDAIALTALSVCPTEERKGGEGRGGIRGKGRERGKRGEEGGVIRYVTSKLAAVLMHQG